MPENAVPLPVRVCLRVTFDATPGTFDEAQIVADAKTNLFGTVVQLGFGYGAEPYQVVTDSVKIEEE